MRFSRVRFVIPNQLGEDVDFPQADTLPNLQCVLAQTTFVIEETITRFENENTR